MREQLTLFNTDRHFHNTIKERGTELMTSDKKARTQGDYVLAHFKLVHRATALQVADALAMHESSARRSVTNLYKRGLLKKTDVQVMGRYGKKNYIFELVINK